MPRRDGAHRGQTGMGLYVHHSIVHTTKRRADLESERVECMWVEIKHSPSSAALAGYVYSNPAVSYAWFDDFVKMMDMVVHPGKTKSMVLVSREKHQLKSLIHNLTLGTNITEQVREHRVLGITIDEELKWQRHTDNICKQVARNLFLLGQLRKYVDSNCRKLFFNAHLMVHINYASTEWSNASEVHFKKKNQLLPQTSNKTYIT